METPRASRWRRPTADVVVVTKISCGGARHRVRLYRDGSIEARDCPRAETMARALGHLTKRGVIIGELRGCAALVALATIGVPKLLAADGVADSRAFIAWRRTVARYETNAITRAVARACTRGCALASPSDRITRRRR